MKYSNTNKTFNLNEMTDNQKKKLVLEVINEVIKKEYLPQLIQNGCSQEELQEFIEKTTDKLLNEFLGQKWEQLKTSAKDKWDKFINRNKPKSQQGSYYQKIVDEMNEINTYIGNKKVIKQRLNINKPVQYIPDPSIDENFSGKINELLRKIKFYDRRSVLHMLRDKKLVVPLAKEDKLYNLSLIINESIDRLMRIFDLINPETSLIIRNKKMFYNDEKKPSAQQMLDGKTIWQKYYDLKILDKFFRCVDYIITWPDPNTFYSNFNKQYLFSAEDFAAVMKHLNGVSGLSKDISRFNENKNKKYRFIK